MVREFIGTFQTAWAGNRNLGFLDDNSCERALQYLCDFGHELMLLQIYSDEDRDPPWTGELELRDAETGAAMKLDFDEDARAGTARLRRVCNTIQTWRCAAADATPPSRPRNRWKNVIFGELVRIRGSHENRASCTF
jgi:hypothetical protein